MSKISWWTGFPEINTWIHKITDDIMLQNTYLDHGTGLTVAQDVISIVCHTAGGICKAPAGVNSVTRLCNGVGEGVRSDRRGVNAAHDLKAAESGADTINPARCTSINRQ